MSQNEDSLILIVDDEQTILTLLSRALAAYGHEIFTAETVSEAVEQVSKREFDLLLVDKNLPDGSGLDIVEDVRKRDHKSEAILITGYSDTESAIQAVALDVFRYVRKPFDLDALKVDIDAALERRLLRRDLARRTSDLEKSNKELWDALQKVYESERRTRQAERLANIGYLAAGVAHEINNPLSLLSMTIPFVTNEIDSLANQIESESKHAELKASISQIVGTIKPTQEAVEFLMRLAGDLHSLSRTEKQDPKPVKIAEVAGSAVRLVRHQLKYKATLTLDIEENLTVNGHASRLVQVFINLLTNGAKAIQRGGPSDNAIKISGSSEGETVLIEVSDTGVGIEEDHLNEIFKPFFTFSLKEEDRGSGIGLALVQEIVDDHKGSIAVSSKKGVGTTFSICLPKVVDEMPSVVIVPTSAREMTRQKRRILFFDSKSANLTAYEKSFGSMHEVLLAGTFEQAVDRVMRGRDTLDALVFELPREESVFLKFVDKIQAWQELKKRFIFIGETGNTLELAKTYGYTVLEKPVRPALLLGLIYKLPPLATTITTPENERREKD